MREPAVGGVKVQEARLTWPVVVEAVDDAGRDDDQRAGGRIQGRSLRAESNRELPLEHVERVAVLPVDVRLRAALPGRMARPGDGQPFVVAEDPQLAVRPVGDRLAFTGAA